MGLAGEHLPTIDERKAYFLNEIGDTMEQREHGQINMQEAATGLFT